MEHFWRPVLLVYACALTPTPPRRRRFSSTGAALSKGKAYTTPNEASELRLGLVEKPARLTIAGFRNGSDDSSIAVDVGLRRSRFAMLRRVVISSHALAFVSPSLLAGIQEGVPNPTQGSPPPYVASQPLSCLSLLLKIVIGFLGRRPEHSSISYVVAALVPLGFPSLCHQHADPRRDPLRKHRARPWLPPRLSRAEELGVAWLSSQASRHPASQGFLLHSSLASCGHSGMGLYQNGILYMGFTLLRSRLVQRRNLRSRPGHRLQCHSCHELPSNDQHHEPVLLQHHQRDLIHRCQRPRVGCDCSSAVVLSTRTPSFPGTRGEQRGS